MKNDQNSNGLEIAVVGMAGKFPGAKDINEFWKNIRNGVESVSFLSDAEIQTMELPSDLISHTDYVSSKGGVLEGKEFFDATFFGYPPHEAELMDPQMRLFHEYSWKALEDAGYPFDQYPGAVGVYAGASDNLNWQVKCLLRKGNEVSEFAAAQLRRTYFLSSRVAYKLNLTGPATFIDTACSTSLVAVDHACRGLLTGICDVALAGGVSIKTSKEKGYIYEEGTITSKDGHCRVFDEKASGTVVGEGIGVVVLKRLDDAIRDKNHIYAVVKGFATNNDGSRKTSYSAPSIQGQIDVIRSAHQFAEIDPISIGYVEAHGTGTELGDPIELDALTQAFMTETRHFAGLGSVKANIGHLDAAAGIVSFIKTVLVVHHGVIPPVVNFQKPNPKINLENSPFYVPTKQMPWERAIPRRAAVSSFGIGGTNAHIILEEFHTRKRPVVSSRPEVISISAKTTAALNRQVKELEKFLDANDRVALHDVAFTLNQGRKQFAYRKYFVASTTQELREKLSKPLQNEMRPGNESARHQIVFLFPGGGSQYINMGKELYQNNAIFRSHMDNGLTVLKQITSTDFSQYLFSNEDIPLEETSTALPLLFIFEYALSQLMMSLGPKPEAMIGHSLGEYVAATIAGVLSFEDAIKVVVERSRLMQETPEGAMLSIQAPFSSIKNYLNGEVSLASVNSPFQCIISGSAEAIQKLSAVLTKNEIDNVILHIAVASHSVQMESILQQFRDFLKRIVFNPPQLAYYSNVSGKLITVSEATDTEYYVNHLRNTVLFSPAIQELALKPNTIFIEVGPGRALTSIVKQHPLKEDCFATNLIKHPKEQIGDYQYFLDKIGTLWQQGINLSWSTVADEDAVTISLPTYSFEKTRFWIDDDEQSLKKHVDSMRATKEPISRWFYTPAWKQSVRASTGVGPLCNETWIVFSNNLKFDRLFIEKALQQGIDVVCIVPGEDFAVGSECIYISPGQSEHYNLVLAHLAGTGKFPSKVVHLWNVDIGEHFVDTRNVTQRMDKGLYSLVRFVKAYGAMKDANPIQIQVITNCLHKFGNQSHIDPDKATLLAAVKIIPLEYEVQCRNIDIAGEVIANCNDLDVIVAELINEIISDNTEEIVAYRSGLWWTPDLRAVPLKQVAVADSHNKLEYQGTYMVVGAFGGMGSTISEFLAKEYKANLILIHRKDLPERNAWDIWQQTHPEDDDISSCISTIQLLERYGSKIHLGKADISDSRSVWQIAEEGVQLFGSIHGIIHAAGVIDYGGIIQERTIENLEQYMNCKVQGTLVLESIAKKNKVNFLVLFSSLGNILYQVKGGQLAYNAGNEFLDAYADYQSVQNDFTTITINWDDWHGKGMAVKAHNNYHGKDTYDATSHIGISPQEGIDAFVRILHSGLSRVAISLSALENRQEQLRNSFDKLAYKKSDESYHMSDVSSVSEPSDAVQSRLHHIFATFFGVQKLGTDDNFFEMGGDSLRALYLLRIVHKEIGRKVSLKEFFRKPTINGMRDLLEADKDTDTPEVEVNTGHAPSETGLYPLTSQQLRMYLVQQFNPTSVAYNMPDWIKLDQRIDVELLSKATQELIKRHEILRTEIISIDNILYQRVLSDVPFQVEYYENTTLDAVLQSSFRKPFNIATPPLFRIVLFRDIDLDYLCIDKHHIISDGHSNAVFRNDLFSLYQGQTLPKPEAHYRHFAEQQAVFKHSQEFKKQERFWIEKFSDDVPVIELPTDFERPATVEYDGEAMFFEIDKSATDALEALAQSQGTTLFNVLLACYTIWLTKVTNQRDIVIGSPAMGRSDARFDHVLGMFINLLPLRHHVSYEQAFNLFLVDLSNRVLEALDNQDYQFEELVDKVLKTRDKSRHPLFDVAFLFQSQTGSSDGSISKSPLIELPYDNQSAKFDITLEGGKNGEVIRFKFEFKKSLFKRETAARFIQQFQKVVYSVIADSHILIKNIDILTHNERLFLERINQTKVSYDRNMAPIELFQRQVEKSRELNAVVVANKQLSYQTLDSLSNTFASQLIAAGAAPDDHIAVITERSFESVIALLAIWKIGGTYIPIDPRFPPHRINYILEDSCANFVVVHKQVEVNLDSNDQVLSIDIDFDTLEESASSSTLPMMAAGPESIAYILYTSGSTGKPKGVCIRNSSLLNFLNSMQRTPGFASGEKLLAVTTFSFDISILELVLPLVSGGSVVVARKEDLRDPYMLIDLLEKEAINVIQATPSFFRNLFQAGWTGHPKLRILCGGEALDEALAKQLLMCCQELWNMYGPTETTIWSSLKPITSITDGASIGRPICNTTFYILNSERNLVPQGVVGDIYIGGEGLAKEYWNRPELTAEKFVKHPFIEGEILYHTGDIGKLNQNGNVTFLGRSDNQVKIKGFRIELGEIERVATNHALIDQAVCKVIDTVENKSICLYFKTQSLTAGELRSYLVNALPSYMIPAQFVKVEDFPLTFNGKVNLKELPAPSAANEIVANEHATVAEQQLLVMWERVLGRTGISVGDNFFTVGGDSMLAIRLLNEINLHFNVKLAAAVIYEAPTVSQLANILLSTSIHEDEQLVSVQNELEEMKKKILASQ